MRNGARPARSPSSPTSTARSPTPSARAAAASSATSRPSRTPTCAPASPIPTLLATFDSSKIDWSARDTPAGRDWLAHVATLLATRHREVVPRLAAAPGHGGRVLAADDGLIAVDWRLDGADLRLRANLTETPRSAPAAAGRVIHGTRADPLPPFAVLVALEERR